MIARALLVAAVLAVPPAAARPPELAGHIAATRPVACHDYGYLLWDLYRTELWSDAAELPGENFALSLIYRTEFSRRKLVEASIEEMARLSGSPPGMFADVRRQLAAAFPDVAEGDRITAWREGPGRLRFYVNGRPTGDLTRRVDLVLDIWLGADARHAAGRRDLLSGRCDG